MSRNQFITVIFRIQVEQMVFLRIDLTRLIQFTTTYSYIFVLDLTAMEIYSCGEREILFTAQRADRYAMVTAAEEERPPIGKLPSMTPQMPTVRGYFFDNMIVTPRR